MIVRYSTAARADIQSIHNYISQENRSVAARVIGNIQQAISRLELFPLSGRTGKVEGTRERVVPRLPYIAVYRVVENTAEIIAVFHASQDKPRGF